MSSKLASYLSMMRIVTSSCILLALAYVTDPAQAQNSSAIHKRLLEKFALTKPTANLDDIVSAGSILIVKKDGLVTSKVSTAVYSQNYYKDGKITQSGMAKFLTGQWGGGARVKASTGAIRVFVPGEKLWVIGIDCNEKSLTFRLLTDPYSDVRYKTDLIFPLSKDSSADQVEKTVAEVFDIQPSDDGQTKGGSAQQQQPQATAPQPAPTPAAPAVEAPPAPIAPPPPPPDAPAVQPPTVEIGQTTDQVVAIFGQPQKVIKLATKQIYVYKDMKVTFVKGKVTDVQ